MRFRLLLFFVLICFRFTTAQNFSRDSLEIIIVSLEKENPSKNRDSLLAIYYNDMCEKCIYSGDERADRFLKRFEESYKKLQWEAAPALWNRAFGKKMEKEGNYQKAIDSYLKAINILENCQVDPKHLTYSYIITGFLLTNNGNTEECIRLFKKAEPLALKQKEKSNIIWIYDYFGDVAYNTAKSKSDYLKALEYYQKVNDFLPNTIVKNLKSNNREGLAKTYWRLGEKEKALKYFDEGLELATKNNEGFNLWNLYNQLALFNEEEGNLQEALINSKKSLDAARYFGYKEFISRSLYSLYFLQKKVGNYKLALSYFEDFKEQNDSLGRNELNAKYKELEAKFKFEIKENEIKDLENEKLYLIGYFILSTMLLGLIVLGFYIYTNKQLKSKNKELKDKNKEISEAIFKGSQMERERVASDLHDSLATKISALKWRIEAEESTLLNEYVIDQLQKLYTDVRVISHDLAPYEFDEIGFLGAVEKLFDNLNLLEKAKFIFENYLTDDLQLPKELSFQLYSIILELSNNVMKHSNASTVILTLKHQKNTLWLSFSDNGSKISNKKEGIGLKNIENRLKKLDGNILFRTESGFEVYIEIPLGN
jgi:two-component system NarL family sensor kinase